jgi:serine/threonine protein kinase
MDSDGYICLADFGLAKIIAKDEKTYSFCGTPEYIAPEVL